MDDFFPFFKKFGFWGILGPPYCGIGATIRIGREMLCLPYAGFFNVLMNFLKLNVIFGKVYFFNMKSEPFLKTSRSILV